MKKLLLVLLFVSVTIGCGQVDNKSNLKSIAKSLNDEMKGTDTGGGFIIESVFATFNTLTYIYSIPNGAENKIITKNELIQGYRNTGTGNTFKEMGINLQYIYKTKRGVTIKIIKILSTEL